MRHLEPVGYALVASGVLVPFLAEHLLGAAALSACTFVLLASGGTLLLVLKRRSGEQENGAGVATLFGNQPIPEADISTQQHGFGLQYASPTTSLAQPLTSGRLVPEPELADLIIEYSHNDLDPITRRNKPLLVKNVSPGKDAHNVRLIPIESPHDRLRFNPERIARLSAGEQVEIIPEPGSLGGGYVRRQTCNHLPDFVAGLYNASGRNDIQALNEIYEERSLMLEIEYESDGRRMVSRCELLYTPWHRNIRTGKHAVRQAVVSDPTELAAGA